MSASVSQNPGPELRVPSAAAQTRTVSAASFGQANGNYHNISNTWLVPGFLISSPLSPASQSGLCGLATVCAREGRRYPIVSPYGCPYRVRQTAAIARSSKRGRCLRSSRETAAQGTADMEDHETRRKIIRQWMALPADSPKELSRCSSGRRILLSDG